MRWRSSQIRTEAEARGIKSLVHFTPFANLRSIVEQGLRPRADLEASKIPFFATDGMRLDDRLGATSLSISNMNHSMFMNKQKRFYTPWAILHLDPSILWTFKCEFCFRNAASREMRWRQYRSSPNNFSQMFEEPSPGYRDGKGLAPCQPTYPDAEVQVFGAISADLIIGVVVVGGASPEREAQDLMNYLNQSDDGDRDAISWGAYQGHLLKTAVPSP